MRHFALAVSREDGKTKVDKRDWFAKCKKDLLILIMACELVGEFEVLEFRESGYAEEDGWTYEDELRERKMLN